MKKILALILTLIMALSLVACGEKAPNDGGEDGDEDALRLMYAVTDKAAQYFNDSYNGFKDVWTANGVIHTLDAPAGGYTPEGQISHLETVIASGEWDVLLVYADKPETLGHIVEYADGFGVKVIGYCQNAETNMGHIYYGTSTDQQGEMCAQMAIDYVDAHPELYAEFDENNKIPYAVMANFDNPQLMARNEKSKEVLDADGRFEMVFEQPCSGVEKAMAYGENLVTTCPDVKIILGASDTEALAVMEVMNTAGYEGDESVGIFSHDCIPETQVSIRNGGLVRGSGYGVYEEMAQTIVDISKDLVAGKTEWDEVPYIHCWGITAENIDEFFPQ